MTILGEAMKIPIVSLLCVIGVVGCLFGCRNVAPGDDAGRSESGMDLRGYSFGYYLNGWRNPSPDTHRDILCFETGYYGFLVDVSDLTRVRTGLLSDAINYEHALGSTKRRMETLAPAELRISLTEKGKVYRAVTCRAGERSAPDRMEDVWLWESGQYAQHYELRDVRFEDADGVPLACQASLQLVAWPDRLAITAKMAPDELLADGPARGVDGAGLCIFEKAPIIPGESVPDSTNFSLEAWVNIPEVIDNQRWGWFVCKEDNEWAEGHAGFFFDGQGVLGMMNIGGGADNQFRLRQLQGHLAHDHWNHLVLTYDGQTMKFYLDGELQGQEEIGRPRIPGTGPLGIGRRGDGLSHAKKALYDEVRIWSRVLRPGEIATHTADAGELPSEAGLIFRKSFSEHDATIGPPPAWNDATLEIHLRTKDREWTEQKTVDGTWDTGVQNQLTLECDMVQDASSGDVAVSVSDWNGDKLPVVYEPPYGSLVARIVRPERAFNTGYTDIRDYDEFRIEVQNEGSEAEWIPFLLDMTGTASSIGMCPILCNEDGVPTGIPVQLSKNWHYVKIGDYLRAYMVLPAPVGTQRYRLRIPYGFYGTLPSASHAQLSLVGWGKNGRWDQLAIGCWGESICFDMDMSATPQTITDVRGTLLRKGKDGKKWGWTDAGWGGDWFNLRTTTEKLAFAGLKAAYLAHGPCLSDVAYQGDYGVEARAEVRATVRTLRTDDYVRTLQTLHYGFNDTISAADAYFFKMDGHTSRIPKIAYGNRNGLLKELDTPHEQEASFIDRVELSGPGPWWIAFPGSAPTTEDRDWGTGSRGLVIRSFRASIGGKIVKQPSVWVPGDDKRHDRMVFDTMLVPPAGTAELKPGDWVDMEVEWIAIPREADDYYGANAAFREHLAEYPRSWRTVHREAVGNDLRISVSGGKVKHDYPVIVQVEDAQVTVDITGGVGFVPIRFDALDSPYGYALHEVVDGQEIQLDQSVHGNDFWQADLDRATGTYRLSFNIPLDGKPTSRWVLRKAMTHARSHED